MLPSTEPRAPLLAASALRVDVGGAAAIDGVSLTSTGEWVLVLGASRALFEAAAGLRAISRGVLLVGGCRAAEAVRGCVAAGAPLDPPLPPRWTVSEYVTWSARLAGHERGAARAMAAEALARLQLSHHTATRLGSALLTVRRGAVLAAALATGASVLLVEDPMVGLPDDLGHAFARAIASAFSDRGMVLFAARTPLESPMALAADEAIVFDGSFVAAQGAPAEIATAERAFAIRLAGEVTAFVDTFRANGGLVLGAAPAPTPGDDAHLTVNLGPLATCDILRIADACDAVVIELRPLADTFA